MGTAVTPDAEMVRLTLDLWHPNCWTTRVTDRTDAGPLGHGISACEIADKLEITKTTTSARPRERSSVASSDRLGRPGAVSGDDTPPRKAWN